MATNADVNFPNIDTLFDSDGDLLEPMYRSYVETAYEQLIWMARVLKWGREHLN